jgi:hypothetical protein
MALHKACFICDRTEGKERESLLSQYIGDFQPEAQVKGLSGLSLMAPTFNSWPAIARAVCGSEVLLIACCLKQK